MRQHQHDRMTCEKNLRVHHIKALLFCLGKSKEIKGLKKASLLTLYWSVHQDIQGGEVNSTSDVDDDDGM